MTRFPLGAVIAGALLIAAGYLFHSGLLFWAGALFAVGFPLGWASWRASVAKAETITALDDKLRENDEGTGQDSDR